MITDIEMTFLKLKELEWKRYLKELKEFKIFYLPIIKFNLTKGVASNE